MKMKSSFLLIIIYFHTIRAEKEIVPTFIIDSDRIVGDVRRDPNPFSRISSTEFSDIIHYTIKKTEAVIIFVEETFCVEDVSARDIFGTPYTYLRQGLRENKVKYIPGVVEPFSILEQIFQPQLFNVFYLNMGMKLQLLNKFKYIYVFFQDGHNETRIQALRRHDLIMKEVYFVVRQIKGGPVVAFYTGKFNPVDVGSLSFIEIEPIQPPVEQSVVIRSEGALFRFRDVFTYTPTLTRRSTFKQIPVIAEETWEPSKLATRMAYIDFELQFNFEFQPDRWTIDSVSLLEGGEEVGRTVVVAGAPWHMSYVCAEPLVIVNKRDGSIVTISQYQIQPFTGNDTSPPEQNETATGFGQAINCGPYFSSHILSGLFVTFILIGILLYGLTTLYNCQTNDRFEDPTAKPFVPALEGAH